MLRLRSCASSMIRVSYFDSQRSVWISASRMPSVMNLIAVCSPTASLKRTWKPTAPPSGTCSSSATRRATERAAIRRGWVQPTMPAAPRPASRHSLGSWVVLPLPVSPATTTTWWARIRATISSACAAIGNVVSTLAAGKAAARRARSATDACSFAAKPTRRAGSSGFAFHFDHSASSRPRSLLNAPSMARRACLDAVFPLFSVACIDGRAR